MDEKHECIGPNCKKEISIFRNFCSRNCEIDFFNKYPELKKKE